VQLARELTALERPKLRFLVETVPTKHRGRAVNEEPGRNVGLTDIKQHLVRPESALVGADEAPDGLQLQSVEPWKPLRTPVGDRKHRFDLLWCSHGNPVPKERTRARPARPTSRYLKPSRAGASNAKRGAFVPRPSAKPVSAPFNSFMSDFRERQIGVPCMIRTRANGELR
jgi:hypothetical protein